jgi:hypothetical protein
MWTVLQFLIVTNGHDVAMTHALWSSSVGISSCEGLGCLGCDNLPFSELFLTFQRILQSVGKNLPNSTVSLLRRLESSATPLYEPQISLFICVCFTKVFDVTLVLVSLYDNAPIRSQAHQTNRRFVVSFQARPSCASAMRVIKTIQGHHVIWHLASLLYLDHLMLWHTAQCYSALSLFSFHTF